MKKRLILVVASLAASLVVAAPAIPADPATTSPGYNFTINGDGEGQRGHPQPLGREARLARTLL